MPAGAVGEHASRWCPTPTRQGAAPRCAAHSAVGALAGLGPTVAWAEAPLSFARARAALELATAGTLGLPAGPLVVADEHGPRSCSQRIRGSRATSPATALAPLAELPEGSRARLAETLHAWLEEQGRLQPIAERLGIHPQTVRYRIARLRELLGFQLDDPEGRFALELALRASVSS